MLDFIMRFWNGWLDFAGPKRWTYVPHSDRMQRRAKGRWEYREATVEDLEAWRCEKPF